MIHGAFSREAHKMNYGFCWKEGRKGGGIRNAVVVGFSFGKGKQKGKEGEREEEETPFWEAATSTIFVLPASPPPTKIFFLFLTRSRERLSGKSCLRKSASFHERFFFSSSFLTP